MKVSIGSTSGYWLIVRRLNSDCGTRQNFGNIYGIRTAGQGLPLDEIREEWEKLAADAIFDFGLTK